MSFFCSRQSSFFLSATWLLLCLSVHLSIVWPWYIQVFFKNCVLIDLLVFQSKDWYLSTILETSLSYYTFKYYFYFQTPVTCYWTSPLCLLYVLTFQIFCLFVCMSYILPLSNFFRSNFQVTMFSGVSNLHFISSIKILFLMHFSLLLFPNLPG